MQELSDYQKEVLLENPNVKKITEKHVIYKSKFKIQAVEKYIKGVHPDVIFQHADIDPNYFITGYCQSCIKRWKKKFLDKGKASLKTSETGKKATGRPTKINTDEMTLEELKAMVEIQHEVIEMLKKNRALAKKIRDE